MVSCQRWVGKQGSLHSHDSLRALSPHPSKILSHRRTHFHAHHLAPTNIADGQGVLEVAMEGRADVDLAKDVVPGVRQQKVSYSIRLARGEDLPNRARTSGFEERRVDEEGTYVGLQQVGVHFFRRWSHLPPSIPKRNTQLPILVLPRQGPHQTLLGFDNFDQHDPIRGVVAVEQDERLGLIERVGGSRVQTVTDSFDGEQSGHLACE